MLFDFLASGPFSWDTLNAIIGGTSALDVPALQVQSLSEAEDFLACYGFPWDDLEARYEVERLRVASLEFMDETLLADEPALMIPDLIRHERDPRKLLLWTKRPPHGSDQLQRWACALLRVAHTVAHCASYFKDLYGDLILEQIVQRFEPHIRREGEALWLGRKPLAIPLAGYEVKHSKPLHSVVLKLLHKSENVAADIFDRVGVRLITRERFDALLVVHYLRLHNVIMFANIKPSRSRNSLLDTDWLRAEVDRIDEEIRAGRMARYEALERLRAATRDRALPQPDHDANPHTSVAYHAIQFTCRQLIRVPQQASQATRQAIARIYAEHNPPASPFTDAIMDHLQQASSARFFFPFEVQIMDVDSYNASREGLASHEEYKDRQRRAAKRRVLRDLLGDLPPRQP